MLDPAGIAPDLRFARDDQLARIEEAGLNAAQPPDQLLIDGWLLRFSPGKARRARSVNAISPGRLPLPEKLAICQHWFAQIRLPLLFRITPFSQPAGLDDFLAQADFVAIDETRVMTRSFNDGGPGDGGLRVGNVDVEHVAQVVGALRGSPERQLDAHVRRLHLSPLNRFTTCLVAYAGQDENDPVAAGQVVVEGNVAGLYDIVTAPHARGRGYGRVLSAQLLCAARAMGARTAYLQVDVGNASARRIYAALGFVDRYAYWYRCPSGTTDEFVS